jgi:plasmid maintenance system antidote protein VapI
MTTIEEIVAAAERLTPEQFVRLRKEFDLLETKLWDDELTQMDRKMKRAGLTDDDRPNGDKAPP